MALTLLQYARVRLTNAMAGGGDQDPYVTRAQILKRWGASGITEAESLVRLGRLAYDEEDDLWWIPGPARRRKHAQDHSHQD